jgi:hypothetical protein
MKGSRDEGQFQKELGDPRRAAELTIVSEQRSSKDQRRQFLKFTEYPCLNNIL